MPARKKSGVKRWCYGRGGGAKRIMGTTKKQAPINFIVSTNFKDTTKFIVVFTFLGFFFSLKLFSVYITGGQITNPGTRTELKKFATIARTENRNQYNQFHNNNSPVFFSRSKTYDDIKSCSQLPSKKSNISQGSETHSITEPIQHQPRLHLHKYKQQTSAFHKKKLQGPCLKESSV